MASAIILHLRPAAALDQLTWWIVYGPMAPERALPIAAFAAAVGLLGRRAGTAAIVCFAAGLAGGFQGEVVWLAALGHLPAAAAHDFYAGPASSIAAGVALISGRRLRPTVTPVAGFVLGVLWALWIRLLDPTLHAIAVTATGIAVAVLLIAAIGLTIAALRREWMFVGAPICGSWLVTIGLLYGGAYAAMRPPAMNLPPPAPSPAPNAAMLDGLFPGSRMDEPARRTGNPFGDGGQKPF